MNCRRVHWKRTPMIKHAILIVVALAAISPSARPAAAEGPAVGAAPRLESVYLALGNVTTDRVAAAVYNQVTRVRGVKTFTWTTARAQATVVRVVGQADTATLLAVCKAAGARAAALVVSQLRLTFQKKLHCNGCVINVKRALRAVKGTKEVRVAKDRTSVFIVYDTKSATAEQLRAALASAGYPATGAR